MICQMCFTCSTFRGLRVLCGEKEVDGDVPLPDVRDRQRIAFYVAALPLRVTMLIQ